MQHFLILIPVGAYFFLTQLFVSRSRKRNLFDAVVKSHVLIFAFIALSTELLSLLNWITFPTLLIVWSFLLAICMIAIIWQRQKYHFPLPFFRQTSLLKIFFDLTIILILVATFVTAILYPPNTWDSMTYHMARVSHWISNQNVSFYPTSITRQNYQMPLAEFSIMHLQILVGSDIFANLIQWVSFLVLITLGVLVAEEFGLNEIQKHISALSIATLPMAILQASGTQNDLVVACFLMCFCLFMLRLIENLSAENILFAALSLGLSVLAKGTAVLYAAALGIMFAISMIFAIRRDTRRVLKICLVLLIIISIALLFNTGHFLRNYFFSRDTISGEATLHLNEELSLPSLLSNLLRNGVLHLGTPSEQLTDVLYRAVQFVLGEQLNNPKTTWVSNVFVIPYSRHEDFAGNLIQMLTILTSFIVLPIVWRRERNSKVIFYSMGILMGAVLYCGVFKWQVWASRLHTPLFVLTAPLLAITITAGNNPIRKWIGYGVVLCMVIYSLPFVFASESRSLISMDWARKDRSQLYFKNRYDLHDDYILAMRKINEEFSEEVGLYLGENDYEYPLWVLGGQNNINKTPITFRHIGVSQTITAFEQDEPLPLYVIATKPFETWEYAPKYTAVFTSKNITVFMRNK